MSTSYQCSKLSYQCSKLGYQCSKLGLCMGQVNYEAILFWVSFFSNVRMWYLQAICFANGVIY